MTIFPLIVSWALSFGYVPEMSGRVYGQVISLHDLTDKMTVADFYLDVTGGPFSIYTNFQNFQYFKPISGRLSFFPVRVGYTIGAKWKPLENLEFIAEHTCEHPVSPSGLNAKYPYNSSITTFSAKLSGKTRIGD